MDKFCLSWNRYDANIREYFRKLREDQILFDVTLATDDGEQIQAHKIILSAGSNFFRELFMRNNHNNMLIYLRGISCNNLNPVIDFIYNGKVLIAQEELEVFLETGNEFQVKCLKGELAEVTETKDGKESNPEECEEPNDDHVHENVSVDPTDGDNDTAPKMDVEILQIIDELSFQINEMIEKNDDVWTCKICWKTKAHKGDLQKHAETHIKGISHVCHICNKTFTNRHNLRNHISGTHSQLLSCEICGKAGMSRHTYRMHKRSKHK